MQLMDTKSYSVESIWTIIDDYQIANHYQEWKEEVKRDEKAFREAQMIQARRAMDEMHTLMDSGFQEHEAWEVVSREIVYRM